MFTQIKNSVNFLLFSKVPTPFKTLYNSGRYPCLEVADFYNDTVEMIVDKEITQLKVSCKAGFAVFSCNKTSLFNSNSDLMQEAFNRAEYLLAELEKDNFNKKTEDIKYLYTRFKDGSQTIRGWADISNVVRNIHTFMPNYRAFEIAKQLPLWLATFCNVNEKQLLEWVSSSYFEQYINSLDIHKKERYFIYNVWSYTLSFLKTNSFCYGLKISYN